MCFSGIERLFKCQEIANAIGVVLMLKHFLGYPVKKSIAYLLALVSALVLTSCAQVPLVSESLDKEAKAFAPAPESASLYIYRNEIIGGAAALGLIVNGRNVAQTGPQTYAYFRLTPGKYLVESRGAENTAQQEQELRPGNNYFLWQEVKLGMILGPRTALHFVDEATGQAGVKECRRIETSISGDEITPLGTLAKGSADTVIKLQQLKKLRDNGLISEDEYQFKRKPLINEL